MDEADKDTEVAPEPSVATENQEAGNGFSNQNGEEETQEPNVEAKEEQTQTNIQTADARELVKRIEREKALKTRTEMIEKVRKSCLENLPSVYSDENVIDHEIKETLERQQQCCDVIIDAEKELINTLQQELRMRGNCYVKDLREFSEEFNVTCERMQKQNNSLTETYRNELAQIEKTHKGEIEDYLTKDRTEWVQHLADLWDKVQESLTERRRTVKEYEEHIRSQKMEHLNAYIAKQIEFNERIQHLERELQCEKGTKKMMQLQERSTRKDGIEKTVLRQRMQTNRQGDKHTSQDKDLTKQTLKLSEDYKRCIQKYERAQKQMKQFAASDVAKYKKLWLMVEADLKQQVEKALAIDSQIHRHLGLAWKRPSMPFMERSGPIQLQKQTSSPAKQPIQVEVDLRCSQAMMDGSESEADTLEKVMELLCDEMGFLMEAELLKQLAPLEKEKQAAMKLGYLLCALGIKEEDAPKLSDFLLKYKQQQSEQTEDACAEFNDMAETSKLIHPNHVLPALKSFLHQYRKTNPSKSEHLEDRDTSEDAAYWESFGNIISEDKLRMWDTAESKLKQYHAVLEEISELIPKTERLKQQNTELRQLLQQIACKL
ncbi:dynein regulatory complex protein 1 [Parambassis ranga]|uniref:Dynein regulatory complex protein 1 n=1 Tax=Parambassis ranga TaxID=210632 RepID=A0A6P7HSY8_9TELE|nr:dynein regulatory complex protein 1 [Parambassis ranga]